MKFIVLVLPAALAALALAGCNNALNQPEPGQTPASINPQTPGYGQAGGSLVPANDPNAQLPATPPGGTPPKRVYAPAVTPTPPGGQGPQQGYFGTTGQPLEPPNPDVR